VLKASGKRGVPQGGVISPLLSNIYLTEVDAMLERAKAVTANGTHTYVEYARYADDLVILVNNDAKRPGKPGAGNRPAGFEVAGAGDGPTHRARLRLHRRKSRVSSSVATTLSIRKGYVTAGMGQHRTSSGRAQSRPKSLVRRVARHLPPSR